METQSISGLVVSCKQMWFSSFVVIWLPSVLNAAPREPGYNHLRHIVYSCPGRCFGSCKAQNFQLLTSRLKCRSASVIDQPGSCWAKCSVVSLLPLPQQFTQVSTRCSSAVVCTTLRLLKFSIWSWILSINCHISCSFRELPAQKLLYITILISHSQTFL